MEISAKNQIRGKVTSVIHGTSYSQVAWNKQMPMAM